MEQVRWPAHCVRREGASFFMSVHHVYSMQSSFYPESDNDLPIKFSPARIAETWKQTTKKQNHANENSQAYYGSYNGFLSCGIMARCRYHDHYVHGDS